MDTMPERLKYARERLDLSQQDVADRVGLKQPSYYKIESGATKRTGYLNEIASVLQVSPEWLLHGVGELSPVKNADVGADNPVPLPFAKLLSNGSDETVPIPYWDIKASCGSGYLNVDYPAKHHQDVPIDFLRQYDLPTSGKGLILMHACNDSMGNTVPDKSLMLVNTDERTYDSFVNDKVYIFNADGEMMCKRAIKSLDGKVKLISDNSDKKTYPDQYIDRDTFNQFNLFGRVHWVFNRL